MDKSFGLLFFLRKVRHSSNGNHPIYLRITVDGGSKEISVKRKCGEEQWSGIAQRATGKTEEARLLDAYLDTLQQKVFEAKRKLLERDTEVSAENIKSVMMGIDIYHQTHTLIEVFTQHNAEMKELIGKQYASATYVRFDTTFRHTQHFLQWRYKKPDMDIRKIDFELITQFEFWFRSVRNCDHTRQGKAFNSRYNSSGMLHNNI